MIAQTKAIISILFYSLLHLIVWENISIVLLRFCSTPLNLPHVLPYKVIGYVYNQSSILIMSIKMKIMYLVNCIWHLRLSSILGMLFFLFTLLLLIQLHIKAGKPFCQMMGNPNYPLISKDGDVTIGALFPIRSIETLPSFEFTQEPQLLSCSRFPTFN